MTGHVTLILGGARSGKSACAERLAAESGRPVLYVATAAAGDDEMAARIAAHRAQRPASWRTIEALEQMASAICSNARPGDAVLLDCLTLWVSNVILRQIGTAEADTIPAETWAAMEDSLVDEMQTLLADAHDRGLALVLVSNEVGMGVVPAFALGRRFQDVLGRVNQAVAAASDIVLLMVAGIPVDLRALTPLQRVPSPPTPSALALTPLPPSPSALGEGEC
jgi:adenosylcobinamide kinase/adenosylcobinamide-phosphate guanylyltransferase